MDPGLLAFARFAALSIGGLFVLMYLLLGRRSYLLYLGLGFGALALASLMQGPLLWVFVLLILAAFLMAVIEATKETKARWQRLRVEQQDREKAFAEFMVALSQKDRAGEKSGKPADVEDMSDVQ